MKTERDGVSAANENAKAGAAVYNRPFLSVYDYYVLGFSNTYVWKCPSRLILDFYNENVSTKHLDVGVGTGYFLDKCKFPSSDPTIALMDLNPNSLQVTAQRLARYHPSTHAANVLEPLEILSTFDSIALNFLLHCLPGTLASKGVVFQNLKSLLRDGGIVFGTTILGQGVPQNFIAKALMRAYNAKGIFCNTQDNRTDLERIMKEHFRSCSVRVVGCVAFFSGRA